jgi:ABC-type uncharacterized transport system permease subunit
MSTPALLEAYFHLVAALVLTLMLVTFARGRLRQRTRHRLEQGERLVHITLLLLISYWSLWIQTV